jgi:PAS domain S-box-containing protein
MGTNELKTDDRLSKIIHMIEKYEVGEFGYQEPITGSTDQLDIIIDKLNKLARSRSESQLRVKNYQNRIEEIVSVLLKYTLLDFSQKIEIQGTGDEIDAIAIGLNTLAEELETANEQKRMQLETIQERNEQIEIILTNAPTAVLVINEKSKILRWNKKAEDIFGWKAEEVLDKPMHEFIMPKRHVAAHYHGVDHYLHTGEGPVINKTIEITAIRKNQEEFPIELSISTVKTREGHFFIGFISDISERIQSQEQIKRTNQYLKNSVKELEAFTYSVSHDLRAPLRAIHGYMNLLMTNHASSLEENARSMMSAVMKNSKKMGQLIDDLLALSRLGRTELQKKKVNMYQIVKSVIEELEKSNPSSSKVKFTVHPLPEAHADQNLITQVYVNLISNAVKYSSQKEHPIVDVGSIQENGETVYYVKDNGSGFDMQFYDKLFGVFQRLHDAHEFEGNGVGLSIVKQIILRHDGRIWATSEIDKGATFYFTLKK